MTLRRDKSPSLPYLPGPAVLVSSLALMLSPSHCSPLAGLLRPCETAFDLT